MGSSKLNMFDNRDMLLQEMMYVAEFKRIFLSISMFYGFDKQDWARYNKDFKGSIYSCL